MQVQPYPVRRNIIGSLQGFGHDDLILGFFTYTLRAAHVSHASHSLSAAVKHSLDCTQADSHVDDLKPTVGQTGTTSLATSKRHASGEIKQHASLLLKQHDLDSATAQLLVVSLLAVEAEPSSVSLTRSNGQSCHPKNDY